ncbi:hypothetical protein RM844_11175 [Streptomyces sp. DSM 44915]|uniref:Gram-positive cocci surface proteins LPxTG domain-containing protein n=1 Tax=Streptomyces chisholmiae TaxID=3075540 RepID=A0ABU2JPD8_9ACTN|nr:hypothetical protein [Streptomyces sp. DSM 44915]MDT0266853.1 hypothetical protein [Streptomyces sp. DSM 44915]
MKRFPRRALATLAAGTVALPALLLAASPAHAAGLPIGPVGSVGELPDCEEFGSSETVSVWLEDIPEEHTSPTAWTEFTYSVHNGGEEPVSDVYTRLEGWYNASDGDDSAFPFELQWYVDGSWRGVPFESDGAGGYFGLIDELPPGESAEAQIRTRALADRPGWFEAWSRVRYYDPQNAGLCWGSERDEDWALVPGAGEAPGEPDPGEEPAEPGTPSEEPNQPGVPSDEPNEPGPQGGSDDAAELAETGGSDALPVAAAVGGAALVAGGGAVLLARRARA